MINSSRFSHAEEEGCWYTTSSVCAIMPDEEACPDEPCVYVRTLGSQFFGMWKCPGDDPKRIEHMQTESSAFEDDNWLPGDLENPPGDWQECYVQYECYCEGSFGHPDQGDEGYDWDAGSCETDWGSDTWPKQAKFNQVEGLYDCSDDHVR